MSKKYGRPKLSDEKRRNAKAYNVRYSETEVAEVEEKARLAGVTTTEWIRCASLARQPPSRRVIPEINRAAYLELSKLIEAATEQVWHFPAGGVFNLTHILSELRREIGWLQKTLAGKIEEN